MLHKPLTLSLMLQIAFTSANCPIFYNLNPKEAFKNKNPFMQMSQHFALLGPPCHGRKVMNVGNPAVYSHKDDAETV